MQNRYMQQDKSFISQANILRFNKFIYFAL